MTRKVVKEYKMGITDVGHYIDDNGNNIETKIEYWLAHLTGCYVHWMNTDELELPIKVYKPVYVCVMVHLRLVNGRWLVEHEYVSDPITYKKNKARMEIQHVMRRGFVDEDFDSYLETDFSKMRGLDFDSIAQELYEIGGDEVVAWDLIQ